MSHDPPPPPMFEAFVERFPGLAEAWQKTNDAGREGPLDERTARLIKLGIAIGARQEGPVHASTRKALAMGIAREEIDHVLRLAASTVGFPGTVAAFSWVLDVVEGKKGA